MQDLFVCNGFTPQERLSARTGAPGRIFFLTPEFIAAYWPLTAMPPERRAEVTACARRLQDAPEARALMWHLYTEFCIRNRTDGFPEILAGLEAESGKIYILLLMALIPLFIPLSIALLRREGWLLSGMPVSLMEKTLGACVQISAPS